VVTIRAGINNMEDSVVVDAAGQRSGPAGTFKRKFAQVVFLPAGGVLSVTAMSGQHEAITEPGLYVLNASKFNLDKSAFAIVQADYAEVGEFYVQTVAPNQMGVVEELASGGYHLLVPNRYYLVKSRWGKPTVQTINDVRIQLGPWTLLTLTQEIDACGCPPALLALLRRGLD